MKQKVLAFGTAAALLLAGCSDAQENSTKDEGNALAGMDGTTAPEGVHIPAGMKAIPSPDFPVGSEATVTADHEAGMKGADATIIGAYYTTVYSVDYEPTDGSDNVSDYKWVVQEELKDPGQPPLADGTPVTILADHGPGMTNAEGTIRSSQDTDVYLIDYKPTDGGDKVENYKWVTEDELETK